MARLVWHSDFWDGKRKGFIIAITAAGLMLCVLFLANLSYIFGALFESGFRTHKLNILAVDYDGGVIGQSISAAYSQLQGKEFPSLQFRSESEYPDIQSVRHAVCKGDYWAAVVAQPGASDRLAAAFGGGTAATNYEANNTLTYVYNGARYPAVQLGTVSGNLATLIGAAGSAYHALNGSNAFQYVDASDPAAILAFTDPIRASSINLMPTNQGTRVLLNTVSMVLPIIQQFFFLMALNGINNSHEIYGRLKSSRIGLMRVIISLIYTFLAALAISGVFWAYKEDWDVNGNQFVLMWMMWWLYAHINFNVLDTVTAYIPPSFLPFFVLTWVILNVASTIYPFELTPGFYRWSYALPAHELYSVLVQIWTGGCNNQLKRALPILFAWEIVSGAAAISGMFYRNKNAREEIKKLEKELDDRARSQKESVSTDDEQAIIMRVTSAAAGPSFPMPFLSNERVQTRPKRQETA